MRDEEEKMKGDGSGKEADGGDPVASLFMRAKQVISSPLYVALRNNPVWTADALRQWAAGRRRPRSRKLGEVAADLRARAEKMNALADEFDSMADRIDRGEVSRRPRRQREQKRSRTL